MAFKYDDIMSAQHEQLVAERAKLQADLESGRLHEDVHATMYAARQILNNSKDLRELNDIANNYYSSQQTPQHANKYGLSPDEQAIAHGISGGDVNLSNDQREAVYAQQRQKLRHMRATGQYRDDQGTVRR